MNIKITSLIIGSLTSAGSQLWAGEVTSAAVTPAVADFLAKGKDTVSVRFAGRTEFQYEDNDDNEEGFEFRRLRLGAKAKLGSGWAAETVVDFAKNANDGGGEVTIRKAIATKRMNDMFKLQLGRDKVKFGHEETSSSSKGVFLERSRLNNRLKKDVGYAVQNNVTLFADLGNGVDAAFSVTDSQTTDVDAAFFARLTWSNDFLTVGVDYADNNDVDAFSVYADYKQGGLNVMVEYMDADLGATTVDGYTARASYRIGDFEPVVRYTDYDYEGSSDDETFIGFNYYIAPQVTLLAGYGETEEGGVEGESLTARLRVLW